MAKTVEELQVYQKAIEGADAISALLKRPGLSEDRDLSSQLNRASMRVAANISEGFEQRTDRHFAKYLYDAKGSAREVWTHLQIAEGRGHITRAERLEIGGRYVEIAKMLRGLIDHLEKSDWKDRW